MSFLGGGKVMLVGGLMLSLAANVGLIHRSLRQRTARAADTAVCTLVNHDNVATIATVRQALAACQIDHDLAAADVRFVEAQRDAAQAKLTQRAAARAMHIDEVYDHDAACRDWAARPVCPDVDGL